LYEKLPTSGADLEIVNGLLVYAVPVIAFPTSKVFLLENVNRMSDVRVELD
jgi:hypothetical protein